jgi:hypothetical protein
MVSSLWGPSNKRFSLSVVIATETDQKRVLSSRWGRIPQWEVSGKKLTHGHSTPASQGIVYSSNRVEETCLSRQTKSKSLYTWRSSQSVLVPSPTAGSMTRNLSVLTVVATSTWCVPSDERTCLSFVIHDGSSFKLRIKGKLLHHREHISC